jgi:hypothetical protein
MVGRSRSGWRAPSSVRGAGTAEPKRSRNTSLVHSRRRTTCTGMVLIELDERATGLYWSSRAALSRAQQGVGLAAGDVLELMVIAHAAVLNSRSRRPAFRAAAPRPPPGSPAR